MVKEHEKKKEKKTGAHVNTDSVRDNIYANLLQVACIFLFMCILRAKKHTLKRYARGILHVLLAKQIRSWAPVWSLLSRTTKFRDNPVTKPFGVH